VKNRIRALLTSVAAVVGIVLVGLLIQPSVSDDLLGDERGGLQFTPMATFCPPPTPEYLAVEPVISPTNLFTQSITVRLNYGRRVTIMGEGGTSEVADIHGFGSIIVPLKSGTANNLEVMGEVYAPGSPGQCTYNYTLRTRVDRHGTPLRIIQTSLATATPATATPTVGQFQVMLPLIQR